MEDTPTGKIKFDAYGGKMTCDADHAIESDKGEDGKCTWQTFNYILNDDTQKYDVCVCSWDIVKPERENYIFLGWFDESNNKLNLDNFSGFDNANDRTYTAKWREQISTTPVVDTSYGNDKGIKYTKEGNSLKVSLKVSKENFPLSELGGGESIVLYYWYESDKPVYDGSDDAEDGYYQRWNGYPITNANKDEDAEITFKVFDNVDFDTANVKIELKYYIVTDGPYIHQGFSNVVKEGPACTIQDTYNNRIKMYVTSGSTYDAIQDLVMKYFQKDNGNIYKAYQPDCNIGYLNLEKGKGTAIWLEKCIYSCSEVISKVTYKEHGTNNTPIVANKTDIYTVHQGGSGYDVYQDCYVIPEAYTYTDLDVDIEARDMYSVNGITFNNDSEDIQSQYDVSYSTNPKDVSSWQMVENGTINEDALSEKGIKEESYVWLKFTPKDSTRKIANVTSDAGYIFYNTYNKCYGLYLSDIEDDCDVSVTVDLMDKAYGLGKVYYNENQVEITVKDKSGTIIESSYTDDYPSSYNNKVNTYELKTGQNYTLTIDCKEGYCFNEYGVGFNGKHTNQYSATTYVKSDFKAGNVDNLAVWSNTSEAIHLIVNNANNTTYGGKGIKPTVQYYKPTDTAKTASTIKASKTNSDGSFEYYLPVLDSDSGCYYQAFVNAKDVNGSPVSATPKSGTSGTTHYSASRSVALDVNSYTAGKYEWDVESVSSKAIPKIETPEGGTVQPTAANGNTFNIPWNKALKLTENNIDGRTSKLQGVSAKCGNITVSGITLKEDKSCIFIQDLEDYAGKTITVTMFTDISTNAGNTVILKVVPAITAVTVSGVKTVGPKGGDQYSALTQEIGIVSGKDYAYTLAAAEKASLDELKAVVFADEEAANASGVNFNTQDPNNANITVEIVAGNKINIATENAAPKDKAGYVVIYNKENNRKVAGFYVNTTAPAWAKTAPTVKATSTNDTEAKFTVTAPNIKTLNSNYYVKIKLLPNSNTQLPSYLKLNETVEYIPVGDDGTIPNKVVNPYIIKATEVVADELGEGCGAKFDAEVSVVLTKSGQSPAVKPDEVITETVAKKVTVTTVAARYADKISLKKSATNSIYAAATKVAVATVDLGKNTDFKTTDFWKVKGIVDASGNDATSKFTKYGSDAVYNPGSPDKDDVNVYVTPKADTPAGKYKVIVQTVIGGTPQAVEAAGEFTVLPTISNLELSIDGYTGGCPIYKNSTAALSKKITVSAIDQDGKVIKNPKVKFTVSKKNAEGTYDAADDSEIAIKNNTISVAKNFDAGNLTVFRITASADDIVDSSEYDEIMLAIKSSAQNIGTLELYKKDGDDYIKITSADEVPYNDCEDLYVNVISKDGTYLLGSETEPSYEWYKEEDEIETIWIDFSKLASIKGPGTVQVTACGLDGTKASAKVNVTYDDEDDYNMLLVEWGNEYPRSSTLLEDDETKNMTGHPASEIFYLSLSNDAKGTTYDADDEDYDYLIEGTMKTEGLKVLEKSSNSQYMKVQLTKPTATITFKDKDKVEHVWTIKNDALSQVEAPKVATMVVNGANGTDKVYANYVYNSSTDKLILTLKNPIKNASGAVIPEEDITVEMIPSSHANFEGTPVYNVSNIGIATITVHIKGKLSGKTTLEFAYKDATGNYLTKTNTVATITPVAFKKSFAVNSTINMSLKDAYTVEIAASKKTGVKSVTYENLLNFNKNGVYNEFADTFKINADKKTITVKDASKLIFKKNLPTALDGYVVAHVVYENGEEADVTSKITVKWVDTTKKYTAVMPTITKGTAQAEIQIKAGGEDCAVTKVRLATTNDKNFASVTTAGVETEGNILVELKDTAYTKVNTYSTNVYIIPDTIGSDPVFASLSLDEQFAMFGIKVPVKVKVVNP